jgi:hypothetical protein
LIALLLVLLRCLAVGTRRSALVLEEGVEGSLERTCGGPWVGSGRRRERRQERGRRSSIQDAELRR